MKNILVTGGCGFIGSNLVKMLYINGYNVTILDNFSRGKIEFLDKHENYTIINVDIRDKDKLLSVIPSCDAIIHLAAYGSVIESIEDPATNFSINAQGTFNILDIARIKQIPKVIFASTGGALIGNISPPVNEQSLPRPISPYGASKLVGEGYCCAFAHSYNMSVTALRFANVIGPISLHKKGAVTAFFKAILANTPITIYGDGTATRDFLYVDDLCRGILSALISTKEEYNLYHLASGYETSIQELAHIACKVANAPNHPIMFYSKRRGEVEKNFASYKLASSELAFKPQVELTEAMKKTWEWISKIVD